MRNEHLRNSPEGRFVRLREQLIYGLRLPVLNSNPSDDPCDECQGHCCKNSLREHQGFHYIEVMECEIDWWLKHHGHKDIRFRRDGGVWWKLNLRCKYLDSNGRCGTYRHRLNACWAFSCGDWYRQGSNSSRSDWLHRNERVLHLLKKRLPADLDTRDKLNEMICKLPSEQARAEAAREATAKFAAEGHVALVTPQEQMDPVLLHLRQIARWYRNVTSDLDNAELLAKFAVP